MAIKCNYIMKLEDSCFLSGPTSVMNKRHLVIVSELAQDNLDSYIKNYHGLISEEEIMRIFT